MSKKVLVTGATGQQGGLVLRELLKLDYTVRAFVRDRSSVAAKQLEGLGAELVQGDFDNPTSIDRAVYPGGRGFGFCALRDQFVQSVAIVRPRGSIDKIRILRPFGVTHLGAEPLPYGAAGYRNIHVTVGGREYAGRNTGRVVVAGLPGHFAIDQPACRLKIEHEDLRFQQRRMKPLARRA